MSFLELAERCETDLCGSDALSFDIWEAVGRPTEYLVSDLKLDPPDYTASLDAAMTLVPEGWHIAYERTVCGDGAEIHNADIWGSEGRPDEWMSEAYSPALALCAAALRARQAQETSNA